MDYRDLIRKLRKLELTAQMRSFTVGDLYEYLCLILVDYEILKSEWGHKILLIPAGRTQYELEVYFDDHYKDEFIHQSKQDYDQTDIFLAEAEQPVQDIFVDRIQ